MKRTYLAGALLVSAGLAMSGSVAQAEDLAHRLPDQTLAVFSVRDFTELKQKFEASRFHDAWQSPELESLRAFVAEQWDEFSEKAEEEAGVRPDQLMRHFEGAFAAFALFMGQDDEGDVNASMGLVAEVPAERHAELRADVEAMLEKVPSDATKSMETFRNVDIYRIQFTRDEGDGGPQTLDIDLDRPFDIQYAFTDEHFLLMEGKNDPLKMVLTSMDDDATNTLGRLSGVQALQSELDGFGDVHILFNFPKFFEALALDEDGEESREVIRKLGLSEIGPGMMTWSLTDFGLLQEAAMPIPRERSGVLAMLSAGGDLQFNTARLAPAGVSNYAAWTLDLKQMWDALYAMIIDFSPEAEAMIGYGMLTAQANFEVDVENDILARVRGEHAFWTKPISADAAEVMEDDPIGAPQQGPQVLFLGLEDGQLTVDTLNRLLRELAGQDYGLPLEETEIRGATVWRPAEDIPSQLPAQGALGFSPAGLVIASSMIEMQDLLRRLSDDAAGASIGTDAQFQQIAQELSPQWLRQIWYTSPEVYRDLDAQMDGLYFTVMMMSEGNLPFERDDIPSAEWFMRYFGPSIQAAYVKPEMLRIHQKNYMVD